jgi:hypothetical protein
MESLKWSQLEYEEKERSSDWFWALGVIVIASSLASIIYGNYFFGILLVISGALLWYFAKRKPEMVSFELNEKGLKIRNHLYPYENIKSFWVQIYQQQTDKQGSVTELQPKLFIKSERFFMPIISMPIEDNLTEDIHFIMTTNNVPEEEMKEHASEKIMESLGF